MTKLLLVGDIHGKWQSYSEILQTVEHDRSVQLGDFGWGFPGQETEFMQRSVKTLHETMRDHDARYIRGNHDNPEECRQDPFCIKDGQFDSDTGIFYMGGALSIDKAWRHPNFDWWEDEELNMDELYKMIDIYEAAKPRVVLTHECPESVVGYMFSWYKQEFASRTRQALDSMFAIHQPELWVFGHWHKDVTYMQNGTQFTCLNELSSMAIDI